MRATRTLLAGLLVAGAVLAAAPASGQTAPAAFLTGTGNGESPDVHVYDADGGAPLEAFNAHLGNTGARVAAGDVDGDAVADYITASGPGTGSQVTIRTLEGNAQSSFAPFGAFRGGVNVAAGDVDGDGRAEIVTAADAGGGPHVIVWDFDGPGQIRQRLSWFAYDPSFRGGVRLASADVTGSNRAEVVTATGPGGGPHVRVWDVSGSAPSQAAGWYAYAPSWTGGVNVGAGPVDGQRSVVTGVGPGGGPHVRLFAGTGAVRSEFYAYAPSFQGGVNVAIAAPNSGNPARVLVAPASWGGPHVKGLTAAGATVFEFFAYAASTINGVHIASIPISGTSNSSTQSGGGQTGSH